MRVAVIGTGYVGLVTGACIAHLQHQVTCLDTDQAKIEELQAGRVPIYEPGIDRLVSEQLAAGRLRFTTGPEDAIAAAEAVFICVGTPPQRTGQADTSAVEAAARAIGTHLGRRYCVVINKSTVPIGSGDWVGMLVRQGAARRAAFSPQRATASSGADARAGGGTAVATAPPPTLSFDVVSNPEFLREGSAIADMLEPDCIVVGADNDRAVERMRALYAPLLQRNAAAGREVPFIVADRASAEMIKYAANAFLATKISFINEIANLCEHVGADVCEVARGIGLDARIGSAFLNAGIGWGGSCFPKDLAALTHTAREYGYQASLLEAVQSVNAMQRASVIRKLQARLKVIKGKTIALWGPAFKPETDDVRDAPALEIARRLSELGAEVRAYDPQAGEAARRMGCSAELCADAYEAARGADAVVLVTEWPEFISIQWSRLRSMMRRPILLDCRNALDPSAFLPYGFEYCGMGR